MPNNASLFLSHALGLSQIISNFATGTMQWQAQRAKHWPQPVQKENEAEAHPPALTLRHAAKPRPQANALGGRPQRAPTPTPPTEGMAEPLACCTNGFNT